MAIYNEILNGRYGNALKKLLGPKGPNPVKQLSGEIMGVLPLYFGVENRFLEEWNRFGTLQTVPAGGAGFNSALRLRTPSNILAVLEKIVVFGTTTMQPRMQNAAVAADFATLTVVTNMRFDARGNPQPSAIMSTQNNAAFAGNGLAAMAGTNLASGHIDFVLFENQEWPILPGDAFQIWENQANVAINVILWWRERVIEPSEKF